MATNKLKQHKTIQPTVDWNHSTGELNKMAEAKQYNLPYAEAKPKAKQFGMRITVDAFHQLLKGALQANTVQKTPTVRYVEFSKASIFRVLSQPGCEYIRFYFVYPEKNKMSLVMEGLDAAQQALKLTSHVMKMSAGAKTRVADDDDPNYEEVGNNGEAGGQGTGPKALAGTRAKRNAASAGQAELTALLTAINTKSGQ